LTPVGLDLCPIATKLGLGPLHSPRNPWEALFITLDHMGVRKSPDNVTQSNTSQDKSKTRRKKAPNMTKLRTKQKEAF